MEKYVYEFNFKSAEGSSDLSNILGGKGSALAEMSSLGLPVPPGFTISAEVCSELEDVDLIKNLRLQVDSALRSLSKVTNRVFGDAKNPLLVSVRSGAKISMPGMMETILNLGLNDEIVDGLSQTVSNPRFIYDSYRRFIQMYASIVMRVDHAMFDEILENKKREVNVFDDGDLDIEALRDIIEKYKEAVVSATEEQIPQDPFVQLWGAIRAVFGSWNGVRAKTYRELYAISEDMGTAVTVQSMVFGNMGMDSATGVVFTRNPLNGNKEIFGEFLVNAQGEDVVAGIRNTQAVSIATKQYQHSEFPSMEELMPEAFQRLSDICAKLERHYRDMLDIEFTVEKGVLWILQSRSGKRSVEAGLKIALDLIDENITTKNLAICAIQPHALTQLLHPVLAKNNEAKILTKGLPASPGAASGKICLSSAEAAECAKNCSVILVRNETSPEDIAGMSVADGVLTAFGGMTSHAAIVARSMGKPCVCGVSNLGVHYAQKRVFIGETELKEGDVITIDGNTGHVLLGDIPKSIPSLPKTFYQFMEIADGIRTMQVWANAETKRDAEIAIEMGAEGIGLCRTEHMFFDPARIMSVRKMILDQGGDEGILSDIVDYQMNDFYELFSVMGNLPVTIRLLDPPLHEFLPHTPEDIRIFSELAKMDHRIVQRRIASLVEQNPMLGNRGCRLGIVRPEIYRIQVRAIFEAKYKLHKDGLDLSFSDVEIMIPLVITEKELIFCREVIEQEVAVIYDKYGVRINYRFGTMIEVPRAAIIADKIARLVDFISFGTNDLTQTVMGISRDDAGKFLPTYLEKGVLPQDPFISIDRDGVGELMRMAVINARSVSPDIKIGICGEHGGDPASIAFCQELGMSYVSCSPYRIPVARLAAAQSAAKNL